MSLHSSDDDNGRAAGQPLRLVAVRCMAELLGAKPSFNYMKNLIAVLVPCMDSSLDEVRVTGLCELHSLHFAARFAW